MYGWLLVYWLWRGEAGGCTGAMTVDSTAADGQQRSAPSLGSQGGTGARRYTLIPQQHPRTLTYIGKPKKDNMIEGPLLDMSSCQVESLAPAIRACLRLPMLQRGGHPQILQASVLTHELRAHQAQYMYLDSVETRHGWPCWIHLNSILYSKYFNLCLGTTHIHCELLVTLLQYNSKL